MSEHEYAGMERPLATKEPNDYARAEKLLLGSVLTFDAPLSMILMSSPGRFKYKTVHCRTCNRDNPHYEENETDVAMSVRLIEILLKDEADTVVLVTGDTDLAPAVRTAAGLFPSKQICLAFPYQPKNKELAQLVSKHFQIRKERDLAHQFPDPVVLPNGKRGSKPTGWGTN